MTDKSQPLSGAAAIVCAKASTSPCKCCTDSQGVLLYLEERLREARKELHDSQFSDSSKLDYRTMWHIQKVNRDCYKLYLFGSFIGAHTTEAQAKSRRQLISNHIANFVEKKAQVSAQQNSVRVSPEDGDTARTSPVNIRPAHKSVEYSQSAPAALAGETRTEAQDCEERAESAGWCSTHNEWFGMCDKAVDIFMKQKLAAAESRIAQLERERGITRAATEKAMTAWEPLIEKYSIGTVGENFFVSAAEFGKQAIARAETAEAALTQAGAQKSALMEAIEPFILPAKTIKSLDAISRDDGKPRLCAKIFDNKITDKQLEQAARVYEQVKEKI